MKRDHWELDEDGNFCVQESRLINIISGCCFLAIFIGVILTLDFEQSAKIIPMYFLYFILLFGAAVSFAKAADNKTFIIINAEGIFYKERLLTIWKYFENAHISQEDYIVNNYSSGIEDKFNIVLTYFDPNAGGNYVFKIPMTSTQNKSEYQIISAIQYFSGKQLSINVH